MSASTIIILLIIASSAVIVHSRGLNNPEQLFPLLLSSVNNAENNINAPSLNGQNRMLYVIKHIIKYVTSIHSSEEFIDNLVNQQEEIVDKLRVLTFLNKCFQITNKVIQREINRMLTGLNINKKSVPISFFTLEELQQAENKINDLLNIVGNRMAILQTWIPPTMPFLGL